MSQLEGRQYFCVTSKPHPEAGDGACQGVKLPAELPPESMMLAGAHCYGVWATTCCCKLLVASAAAATSVPLLAHTGAEGLLRWPVVTVSCDSSQLPELICE